MRKTRGTLSELSENEQSASASSPRGISANHYLLSTLQTTEFQPCPFHTALHAIADPALNINLPTYPNSFSPAKWWYAVGLVPCLTPDLIRSFIFGTSDSAH